MNVRKIITETRDFYGPAGHAGGFFVCESARNRLEIKTIGAIDCSKAQRENRAQVRAREPAGCTPAGFSFDFAGRSDPLMLLPFKAMLFGGAGKSGRPPPLEPSLKVQRDIAHNQSSGFAVTPRSRALTRAGL